MAPAGGKAAAVEMLRLVHAYGADPDRWRTNAREWIDAVKHVPVDILHDAISGLIRGARTGDHLPRPGDILALCDEPLAGRRQRIQHQAEAAEPWPTWLAELWGPAPEGPRKRKEAMHAEK
jgi:hypothetical protein